MLSQALSKSKDSSKSEGEPAHKSEGEPAQINEALPETDTGAPPSIVEPLPEPVDAIASAAEAPPTLMLETEQPPTPEEDTPTPAQAPEPGPTLQSRPASSYKVSVDEARDIILRGLQRLPDFPSQGVVVTLYGSRPWNAMLTFAPGSTSYRNAVTFRNALTEMITGLRKQIDVEVGD